MSRPVLELSGITKAFDQGENKLVVLAGCSLAINPGQLCALTGPSGAGKSTLLQICGLLERADAGEVKLDGVDVSKCDDAQRTECRRQLIGFVYQYHHLLPEFSALENVILPQMISNVPESKAAERARNLLDLVGLSARTTHRPAQLSGGEQQRVAIARALANAPKLLIADEPTGNLDPHTADGVFNLFHGLCRQQGLAVLMATHNVELAKKMDRTLALAGGKISLPH